MQRVKLGRTGIEVSEFCLGTMTWGNRNTEAEGHAQIDMALDHGIDFMDTAEMYPVAPVLAETAGRTEEIVGTWVEKSGRRADVVIATKICGPNPGFVRDGRGIDPESLRGAVEGSLKRLRTDYIDLYQLHWPNRGSYHFRQNWRFDPTGQDSAATLDHMAEVAATLADIAREGKIRAFGLSNDSAWGTMQWLAACERAGAPRVSTMQNEYSLLCRLYDTDMAELSHHEDITLLAYSPLAAGILTGKYNDGTIPENSRMSRVPGLAGRLTERVFSAVRAYHAVAEKHGLDPVQMGLAFLRTRPFETLPIIGATSIDQLKLELGAVGLALSDEVLDDIDAAHRAHAMPF